ncbi:MAG: hypothetical protein PHV43_02995 [Candidatus Colwellbacteria bacterium]|nr:hypothetical protein [Candidatus Colwellbacteria bacterium]
MAFSFETQSDKGKFWNVIGLAAVIVALGAGTYLLFFTEEPLVDVIVPPELESISKLSDAEIEEGVLTENPVYQQLGSKVNDIEPGEAGRDNPFAPF